MRSGVRTHGSANGHQAPPRQARADVRLYDATPRQRSHGGRPATPERTRRPAPRPVSTRDALKRRRANVLFVLVLIAGCALFLAATTKAPAMFWVFGAAFVALCAYVYVLGQLRQRELLPAPRLTAVPSPRSSDRWQHAV
jgi:hypothetical protein